MKKMKFKPQNRKKIYEYILQNPGIHIRELSRNLKIPVSTLRYHLKYLKKKNLIIIESYNERFTRCYSPKKIPKDYKKYIKVLRQPVTRAIIIYLLLNKKSTNKEIKEFAKKWKKHPSNISYFLDKHRTTILFHLKNLLDLEIVEIIKDGNKIRYSIKEPEYLFDILISNKKEILGKSSDIYYKWLTSPTKKDYENIENNIYNVFPHPYHI